MQVHVHVQCVCVCIVLLNGLYLIVEDMYSSVFLLPLSIHLCIDENCHYQGVATSQSPND